MCEIKLFIFYIFLEKWKISGPVFEIHQQIQSLSFSQEN